jgi:hypothetical protein
MGTSAKRTENLMLAVALALALAASAIMIVLIVSGHVRAEPLPYPKGREQCSSGYVQSGAYCVPKSGGTVRPAVPRVGTCPSGWSQSGGACERMR